MFEDLKKLIRKGMLARTTEGKPLGEIFAIENDELVMDGAGGANDYVAEFDQVREVKGELVIIEPKEAAPEEVGETFVPRGVAIARPATERSRPESFALPMLRERAPREIRLRKRVVREVREQDVLVEEPRARRSQDVFVRAPLWSAAPGDRDPNKRS